MSRLYSPQGGRVVIDLHTGYQGYHADMARTIFLPDTGPEPREAYAYFKGHVAEVIGRVKAGVAMQDVRRWFHQGFERREDWIPLTGPTLYGVGLKNFELPALEHPFEATGYIQDTEANMVLALSNIGLYSKQGWGVRVEETFVVTEGEPIILTKDA